jgi:hypothetical protein
MLHGVNTFRGEVPALAPELLPDNAAQVAENARLFTGNLTAFKQFSTTHGLANAGPVRTISLMASQYWLSWDTQVDVARGVVPGDTTYRTYLTGLDVPRFTNLALATTGPEPYPVQTRLLGVPPPDTVATLVIGIDPTPTTFSIDVTDAGDDLATKWSVNTPISGATKASVTQSAGIGNPPPSYLSAYDENHNPGEEAYGFRNFGVAGSTVLKGSTQILIGGDPSRAQASLILSATAAGAGFGVVYNNNVLSITKTTQWSASFFTATLATVAAPSLGVVAWHTLEGQAVLNNDGTKTITATLYDAAGTTVLATVTATNIFDDGDFCGFANGSPDDASSQFETYYDNIHIQASGQLGTVITNIATNYVYTFVNDLGEESAPSLPSATVLRPDGVSVTVTTPTGEPTGVSGDYFITTKRIYRAATGSTGTAYRFVAEIPLSQADYVDTLHDTELGEVLQSDIWALPPTDLQGILALPNGVMVGFRRNQLCFSAQNQPHAWPVEYRLNTDTDIVGIGNIDTTVVIGTKSFVYVASGNDPANYSMSKFEVPHAASSKLSFAYITGLGVVFSGPQGLMVVAGVGQLRNLTENVFTLRQWQSLNPASIFSVAHNDIYFMFWESGSTRGCFAVDLRKDGFGIVEMAFHASAAYVDPIEDKMYLVLDYDNEPDDPMLPIPPSIPTYVDARTIFQFEGSPTELMTYRYRTKLWLEPYPAFHSIAQVRSSGYFNTVIKVYGDGILLDEIVVQDDTVFTLTPPTEAYATFEMELIGTDTVRVLQAADDVTELA